jgi:hypothetical protein
MRAHGGADCASARSCLPACTCPPCHANGPCWRTWPLFACRVCDLDERQTVILLLTTITSTMMLGFKLAYVEVMQKGREEQTRLELERQALIHELEQSTPHDMAEQVQRIGSEEVSALARGPWGVCVCGNLNAANGRTSCVHLFR